MSEQKNAGCEVSLKSWLTVREIRTADEVWCHCGWYYGIWWAVAWAKLFGKRICWLPAGCYDPVRLAYHGWKKRLVGPIERWALRQCDEIAATCAAEAEWVRTYEPRVKKVVVMDVKRFFRTSEGTKAKSEEVPNGRPLRILYLGREHPLKGTAYLKQAVAELGDRVELKMASTARDDELEALWRWADVFVLPTVSDNFGLVVAEALEHGVPVITTDGAPAWELPEADGERGEKARGEGEQWWNRLVYLRGYRDGTDEDRVRLLREALSRMAAS